MHGRFCMKFYTTAKQSNIRFSTKFCLIISENDTIMLFEPRQIPISQLSSTCRTVPDSLKLSSFEPTGLSHLDYQSAMLKKYHKFINSSQSLRRLMSRKPPTQTTWEELPQKRINKEVHLYLVANNRFSPTDVKTTLESRNAEKWGLFDLKHHNFVIFKYILTKLGMKRIFDC